MRTDSLLLDTHVWFNSQTFPDQLRASAAAAVSDAAQRGALFVSVISVWELALHARSGKVTFNAGVESWVTDALNKPGISLLPYTPEIAIESVFLPAPMHKDPADRILIASARIENLTIVTADKAMLAFARTTSLPHLTA